MGVRRVILDYYEILRVSPDDGPEAIDKAYKAEVLKFRDQPGGGEQTRRINLAYTALSNPERRRQYDAATGRAPIGHGVEEDSAEFGDPHHTHEHPPQPPEEASEHAYDAPQGRKNGRVPLVLGALGLGVAGLLALLAPGVFQTGEQVPSRDRGAQAEAPTTGRTSASDPAKVGQPKAGERGQAILSEVAAMRDAVGAALLGQENVPPSPVVEQRTAQTGSVGPESRVASATIAVPTSRGETLPRADTDPAVPPEEPSAARAASAVREEPLAPSAETVSRDESSAPPAPELVRVAPGQDRSSPPRRINGGLLDSDNRGGRYEGTVGLGLSIGSNGRLERCRVTRSSGSAALDGLTCRLLRDRLQFDPARDSAGNPVSSEVQSTQIWGRRPRN